MPAENIRILTRTWADVWPHTSIWRPSQQDALLFIGSQQPVSIDAERVRAKLANPRLRESLARIGIVSLKDFVGKLLVVDDRVRAASRGALINTDDNSRIEYDTPPNAMSRDESGRVWALFQAYRSDPWQHVTGSAERPPHSP